MNIKKKCVVFTTRSKVDEMDYTYVKADLRPQVYTVTIQDPNYAPVRTSRPPKWAN